MAQQELHIRFRTAPIVRGRCVQHDKLLHGNVNWSSIWGEGEQPNHAYMTRPELAHMVCPGTSKDEGELQDCQSEWTFELVSHTRRIEYMAIF